MSNSETNKKLMKDTYDKVSASSELMERLMKMEQKGQTNRKQRTGWGMKVAAAVLALSLTGGISAYAAGFLKPLEDVFSHVFHLSDQDQKTVEEIGQSVGVSDEEEGVEVTVDGIMTDGYQYAIVLSIGRTDGKSLAKQPQTQIDTWNFEDISITVDGKDVMNWGKDYSFDQNPNDNTIQYVLLSSDNELQEDMNFMELRMCNLCNFSADDMSNQVIVEGEWKVQIPSNTKNVAELMVENQTINIEEKEFNIASIAISPMGYHMEYTIPKSESKHMAEYMRILEKTPIELVLKDGTTINLTDSGSEVEDAGDVVKFVFGDIFETLVQMDEIRCVRIAGEEYE